MQSPLKISFRGMKRSDAVEERIREKVQKLEQYYDRIQSCRVVVEAPHRHHSKGQLYCVRVDLTLPGEEIVVAHEKPGDHAHEDVYVAIRDSFEAARRQLKKHVRMVRDNQVRGARQAASQT